MLRRMLWVVGFFFFTARSAALRGVALASRRHSGRPVFHGERTSRWRRAEATADQTGEVAYRDGRLSHEKLEALEAWLDEAGVDRCGSTTLECFSGRGVGLRAAVELERDSTVASIPRCVCLSSDAADAPAGTLRASVHALLARLPAFETIDSPALSEKAIPLERDVVVVTLQVWMECLAGASSAFAPWMSLLPRTGGLNLPALWQAGDLETLKGTLVLNAVETCVARAGEERSLVEAAFAEVLAQGAEDTGDDTEIDVARELIWVRGDEMKGRPTLAEWLHARCTVQSRAYRVGQRYILIPLVDFANHDDNVAFAVGAGDGVFTGSDEVVFVADRSYQPGQEVYTTYGDMDNAKRLLSFGFVTLYRPAKGPCGDELPLPTEAFCDVTFPVADLDPLRSFKEGVFGEYRLQTDEDTAHLGAVFDLAPSRPFLSQITNGPARSFVKSAMPLLRLAALNSDDFTNSDMLDFCERRRSSPTVANTSSGGTVAEALTYHSTGVGEGHVGCFDGPGSSLLPDTCPVLVAGRGEKVLERLGSFVSRDNERQARRLLSDQCVRQIKEIGLSQRDSEALAEAACEGDGQETFVASEPRSLLCAAVRVGEAIAWQALLEVCGNMRSPSIDVSEDKQTWASWVSEQCRSTERGQ